MAKIGSRKTCKAFNNDYTRCNNQFSVNHPKQKFCSDRCRKRNNRKIKERETKKKEKEKAKFEKQNKFSRSRAKRADVLQKSIMDLFLSLEFYKTPIAIPKKKSLSDFSYDSDSLYQYTKNKTELERKERYRKEVKKEKIKAIEEKIRNEVSNIFAIYSFIPEDSKEDKKAVEKIIKNLKSLDNIVGEIARKKSNEIHVKNMKIDFSNIFPDSN